jgi:aspartate ammonia-lyase
MGITTAEPDTAEARIEHDLLGTRKVPDEALYGIHTARALENFPHGGLAIGDVPELCLAFVAVKAAAAEANVEVGALDPERGAAIVAACAELIAAPELLLAQLRLPVLQGGAGTSTNMSVNEVIANRALAVLGRPPGDYAHLHPNDHVNRSQSTNDVYPTALQLALALRDRWVCESLERLAAALAAGAARHQAVPKLGRTQLRDAVPMALGQEFGAWADGCRRSVAELGAVAAGDLRVLHLGGTAIGTGLNAPDGYAEAAVRHLGAALGMELELAARPVSATTDPSALLAYSAALRSSAVRLGKLANDLRLLSSGPRAGLGELLLPPVQAGSSMMPGKVNPVIPEYANQLCFRIRGLDQTVTLALDAAQLQLSAMVPAAADALLESQGLLRVACDALSGRCVAGIEVDEERLRAYAGAGLGELTSAAAVLGYETGSAIAGEADRSGVAPVEAIRRRAAGAADR